MKLQRGRLRERLNRRSHACSCSVARLIAVVVIVVFVLLLGSMKFLSLSSIPPVAVANVEKETQLKPLLAIEVSKRSQPPVKQNSEFAYVTLIAGIDKTYRYRGFLYNTLIMKKSLVDEGSEADFIALLGYSDEDMSAFQGDIDLLSTHGIIVHVLSRLLDRTQPFGFAEMALLKITPWSFTQYKRVQFFDGDVMPIKNMDCFFQLEKNTFTVGAVSPLNSGWYVAIPNMQTFEYMRNKAIWRLHRDWDQQSGWNEAIPTRLTHRGGKVHCKLWDFNGADMDQGLFTHYFIIKIGNAMLIDTELKNARTYSKGLSERSESTTEMSTALSCCSGVSPIQHFAHFTGRGKPWMVNLSSLQRTKNNENLLKWATILDTLDLPIKSVNIFDLGLGSPLGFFNAKFPKGGFKSSAVQQLKL